MAENKEETETKEQKINNKKTFYNKNYKNENNKKKSKYDDIVLPKKSAKQRLQSVVDMCRHCGWDEENVRKLIRGWWD